MRHDDYLELARELNSDALHLAEAKIRTAISRAYYFILIKLRDTLENHGHKLLKSRDSHEEVVKILQDIDGGMASRLRSLRTKRNEADYEFACPKFFGGSTQAQLAIGEAVGLNNSLERIGKEKLKPKA